MSSFSQMFSFGSDDDESEQAEEPRPPIWLGAPENELGVVVPEGIVLARSDRAVVALSHATVYSTGVGFEFVAVARGLVPSEAHRVFHDQHAFSEDELPDAMLRIGFELADGGRVSNFEGWRAYRTLMDPDSEPRGPLLFPHGGGGGNSSGSRVTMRPGYWLWPLPPPGPIRISCEWPFVDITLTTAEINSDALLRAARQSPGLWSEQS